MTATDKTPRIDCEAAPPSRVLREAALPAVLSQLISLLYNMADVFFVGLTGDAEQAASVSLAAPLLLVLTALANLFGLGGAAVISRSMAQQRREDARRVSALCFYCALAASCLISLCVLLFPRGVLYLLGARGGYDCAADYLILAVGCGGPFFLTSLVLSHFMRADGSPRLAGLVLSAGGALNLLLDPLFIFGFGLGVAGAAAATLISNMLTLACFLSRLFSARDTTLLSLSPRRLGHCGALGREVVSAGLPGMLQTLLAAVSNAVLNRLAAPFGPAAIAALGAVKKLDQLPMSVTIGLSQGVVPAMSYYHSAGDSARLRGLLRLTLSCAVGFSCLCVLCFELFAEALVGLFIRNAGAIAVGAPLLRIMCVSVPFMAVGFVLIALFQAAGLGREGSALSLLRKGALDIPLMLLFSRLAGLYGLACAQPLAELAAMLTALILLRRKMPELTQRR